MDRISKQCEWCKILFTPKRKSIRFCSRSCGSIWARTTKGTWNKNLTKETDDRVKNNGMAISDGWQKNTPYRPSKVIYQFIDLTCNWCEKVFQAQSNRSQKFCSRRCTALFAGSKGVWNKGLTKETSSILKLVGEKTSKALTGRPSPHKKPSSELRNYNCKQCKIIFQASIKKNRQFCSVKCSIYFRMENTNWINGRKFQYKFGDINMWMRSNWEVLYANFLTLSNLTWKYESKGFETSKGFYVPDFYIKELNEWHEIKGFWTKVGKAKYDAFQKEYPHKKTELIEHDQIEAIKETMGL